MHQGKVVAVRPAGSRLSEPEELYGSPVQASLFSGKKPKPKQKGPKEVFIEVTKDKYRIGGKSEEVVWYEDPSGRLTEGDLVTFKIDRRRKKSIDGAIEVEKTGSVLPISLLSKILLFASTYFLISTLLKDNQSTREEAKRPIDYR
jgi:hypothetical protein